MIRVNMLIKWISEDDRVERILWFSRESNIIFLINVLENKMPEEYSLSYIEEMILNKKIIVVEEDKYINILREEEISTLYIEYRNRAWEIISKLVIVEPDIYISKYRRLLTLKILNEINSSESTINRYLKRYWIGGKNKNALIPKFNNSGGRGKEKTSTGKKRGRPRLNKD